MVKKKNIFFIFIGFLIMFISILIAYNSPPVNYELSIYKNTPVYYWVGVGLSSTISFIVTFTTKNRSVLFLSLALGGLAIISIISLPLIRGYYYYGVADPIGHLGFTERVLQGNANLVEVFYPAIHSLAISIHEISNLSVKNSLVLTVSILATIFLIFIPLVLTSIEGKYDDRLIIIGTYSAMFFLPINLISSHFKVIPSSQALLFSPILIYLFIKYFKDRDLKILILYLIFFWVFILFHPQFALAISFGFFVICFFFKINKQSEKSSFQIPLISLILFWIWSAHRVRFEGTVNRVVSRLLLGDIAPAGDVSQRGFALSQIGASIEELFLKIFLITLIFGILSLIYIYKNNIKRGDEISNMEDQSNIILYLFLLIFPIGIFVLIYLILGAGGGQAQRYTGLIQVIISITGPYSLFHFTKDWDWPKMKKLIIIFVIFSLVISVPTFHHSPYVYRSSPHVTQTHYEGYERVFSYHNDSLKLRNVRMDSCRYYANSRGVARTREIINNFTKSPDHFNNQSLSTYYERRTYLAITEYEIKTDAELYNGFRFSKEDFQYLNEDHNINKIYSNGGFYLYMVNVDF